MHEKITSTNKLQNRNGFGESKFEGTNLEQMNFLDLGNCFLSLDEWSENVLRYGSCLAKALALVSFQNDSGRSFSSNCFCRP